MTHFFSFFNSINPKDMKMSTLILSFSRTLKSFTCPPPQRRHASSSWSRSTWRCRARSPCTPNHLDDLHTAIRPYTHPCHTKPPLRSSPCSVFWRSFEDSACSKDPFRKIVCSVQSRSRTYVCSSK